MKKIITYGTFDLFHYGHYNLLKRAKELGDYLVVGVSSDAMCTLKGKKTVLEQSKRMEIVANLRFVDEVILEETMEQKVDDAKKMEINAFVLGDDYKDVFPKMKECQQLLDLGCEVIYLERTPEISTTKLKRNMLEEQEIVREFDVPKG